MSRLIARLSALALTLVFAGGSYTSAALAKDVQIKGYTKKDGTVVKGYTKHVKDDDTKSGGVSDKKDVRDDKEAKNDQEAKNNKEEKTTKKDADGAKTIEVKGYTKKDGTVVKGYTRKKSSK